MTYSTNRTILGATFGLSLLTLSTTPMLAQTGRFLPLPSTTATTVPANGDVNPYGIVFVPSGFPTGGPLQPGDVLVSNFNNKANLQGTGSTIVRINAAGQTSTFFQGQPGLGLTAALGILRSGYILVGNMPTTDGTSATVQQGSLLILNPQGTMITNLTDPNLLNGPWDMTIDDQGDHALVFVSNVQNGTVSRYSFTVGATGLTMQNSVRVASSYMHRFDPAALVVGPSGLAYDPETDTLYVSSTGDNAVFAVANAESRSTDGGAGTLIYRDMTHLHGPLGLAIAPNGHLLAANADAVNVDPNQPSEIVEFAVDGTFVAQISVDANNGGSFNLRVKQTEGSVRFAAVDDNANTLIQWKIPVEF
jgi:sugar lactone lactonase YvrE